MSDHCFTYGSLMCEDIMGAVCGTAPLTPVPARPPTSEYLPPR